MLFFCWQDDEPTIQKTPFSEVALTVIYSACAMTVWYNYVSSVHNANHFAAFQSTKNSTKWILHISLTPLNCSQSQSAVQNKTKNAMLSDGRQNFQRTTRGCWKIKQFLPASKMFYSSLEKCILQLKISVASSQYSPMNEINAGPFIRKYVRVMEIHIGDSLRTEYPWK